MTAAYQNRIVGYGSEAPDQLLANPANWRVHPQYQQEALEGVLSEVGWVQNVIVNRTTGHMVDGHLRVTLALRRSEPQVPVTYVELDENEERLILATIDPLAGLAATDVAKLDDLLREVTSKDGAVQQLLADIAAREGLHDAGPPSLDDLEAQYGEPDETRFWPVIQLRVDPETHERYTSVLRLAPGDTECERFAALLDAVDVAVLSAILS